MSKKLTLVARKMKERGHATHLSSMGYRVCPPSPILQTSQNDGSTLEAGGCSPQGQNLEKWAGKMSGLWVD